MTQPPDERPEQQPEAGSPPPPPGWTAPGWGSPAGGSDQGPYGPPPSAPSAPGGPEGGQAPPPSPYSAPPEQGGRQQEQGGRQQGQGGWQQEQGQGYPPPPPPGYAGQQGWQAPGQGHPGQGYQGQGYPGPGYQGQGAPVANPKSTWALVVGIVALLGTCCTGPLGLVGIAGIVLGVQARKEIRESGGTQGGDGAALTGIILGSVATVGGLLVTALSVWIFAAGFGPFLTTG